MKHSPAPWRLAKSYNNECVIDARGRMVADCCIAARGVTQEMVEANARLCAAAPDVTAALRDLLAAAERHIFSTECKKERNAARAALAKADGKAKARG